MGIKPTPNKNQGTENYAFGKPCLCPATPAIFVIFVLFLLASLIIRKWEKRGQLNCHNLHMLLLRFGAQTMFLCVRARFFPLHDDGKAPPQQGFGTPSPAVAHPQKAFWISQLLLRPLEKGDGKGRKRLRKAPFPAREARYPLKPCLLQPLPRHAESPGKEISTTLISFPPPQVGLCLSCQFHLRFLR